MSWIIADEIDRFNSFPKKVASHLAVEAVCEHGFVVKPRTSGTRLATNKKFGLTILGLTHGNEYAGVAVLNNVLALINSGVVKLEIPVVFVLGNPWAALENKRFLDRDLNRSFCRVENALREEKRADVLEGILKDTSFLVDFHQVSRPSDRPFFIFPYTKASYGFAREIFPAMTMVTHWGDSFSSEGMCTDEFVNLEGGTGISIELGQNGFDVYQVAAGTESAVKAIYTANRALKGEVLDAFSLGSSANRGELYSWAEIIKWPDAGIVDLKEGWINFGAVKAGEALGTIDGRPINVREGGRILFPKYLTHEQQLQLTTRPTELCRIMKPIAVSDLPS